MVVSLKLLGAVSKFALGNEIVTICVLVLIISILVSSYLNQRRVSFLPGLKPLPIIGNTHQIAPHLHRFVAWAGDIIKAYGGITRIWVANNCIVLTTDLDLVQKFYTSPQANENFVTDTFRSTVGYMLGQGLVTSVGKHWAFSRKTLAPSFSSHVLKNFIPIIAQRAEELIEKIGSKCEGGAISLSKDIATCTYLTIAETHLQLTEGDMAKTQEIIENMDILMQLMHQRGLSPWEKSEKIYHYLPSGKMALKVKTFLTTCLQDIRQKAIARLEDRKLEGDFEWKKKVFINTLILNGGYTDQQIIDELATVLAAGSETTANSLGFLLLILGQHQDIQQKVYEEDLKILEEASGRELNHSDLAKYTYLDRVIKESLRMFPIIPLMYRRLTADLECGKNKIPAGSEFVIHTLQLHRDPNTYPDPMKFDPDRFLPENVAKRHPFAFIPFGYGNRICLGWRFSSMSMKIIISTIIRNFHVFNDTPLAQLNLKMDVTLKDGDDVRVRLERR